jgi:hypothetical protein
MIRADGAGLKGPSFLGTGSGFTSLPICVWADTERARVPFRKRCADDDAQRFS